MRPGIAIEPLPSRRTLLVFPGIVMLVAIAAVLLGLNGWSTGAMREEVTPSHDSRVLLGVPRQVRSDEWNVQSVWAIAQVQQGLPTINRTFPYGMDATLPQDLPRRDWTVIFRPHLWGFLILPLDQAFAVKWWMLLVTLVISTYLAAVILASARPIIGALVAVGFSLAPFFQWWFLAPTIWPVVWGFAAIVGVEVAYRSPSRATRIVWAAVVGFLTVVVGMGIYVPFIVPVAVIVAFWTLGRVVSEFRTRGPRRALLGVVPLVVATVGASGALGAWLLSRAAVVSAFLGTTYPGPRVTPGGSAGPLDIVRTLADSFAQSLGARGLLGQNSSEGATFFLVGLFLLPVVVVLIVRQRVDGVPWQIVGVVAALVVVAVFLFIPYTDLLGRLTGLNRATATRMRVGLGFASVLLTLFVVAQARSRPWRDHRVVIAAGSGALAYLATQTAIAWALGRRLPDQLTVAWAWWIVAILGAAAILLLGLRRSLPAAAAFCAVAVATGAWVNPVYRGAYDLRATAVSRVVRSIEMPSGRSWVAVGDGLTSRVLIESGSRTYNGFQGAPSRRMWRQIDPRTAFQPEWNRLGEVAWTPGTGEPTVSTPAPDRILVTFDSCSSFAQKYVGYVLGDESSLREQPCLQRVRSFRYSAADLSVYRVIARVGASGG